MWRYAVVLAMVVIMTTAVSTTPTRAETSWGTLAEEATGPPAKVGETGGAGELTYSFNWADIVMNEYGELVAPGYRAYTTTFTRPANAQPGDPLNPCRYELHGLEGVLDHWCVYIFAEEILQPRNRMPIVTISDNRNGVPYRDSIYGVEEEEGSQRHDDWRWSPEQCPYIWVVHDAVLSDRKVQTAWCRHEAVMNPAAGYFDGCTETDDYLDPWGVPQRMFAMSGLTERVKYETKSGDIGAIGGLAVESQGSWKPGAPCGIVLYMDDLLDQWLGYTNDPKIKLEPGQNHWEMEWYEQDVWKFKWRVYGIDKTGRMWKSAIGEINPMEVVDGAQEIVQPEFELQIDGPRKWLTKKVSDKATYTFKVEQTNKVKGQDVKIMRVIWETMGEMIPSSKSTLEKKKVFLTPTKVGEPYGIYARATVYWEATVVGKKKPIVVVVGDAKPRVNLGAEEIVTKHLRGDSIIENSIEVQIYDTEITDGG